MAIRAWQLKHDGQFPDRLEAIVPDDLPSLPTDPYSGKPFGYLAYARNPSLVQQTLLAAGKLVSDPIPPETRVLFTPGSIEQMTSMWPPPPATVLTISSSRSHQSVRLAERRRPIAVAVPPDPSEPGTRKGFAARFLGASSSGRRPQDRRSSVCTAHSRLGVSGRILGNHRRRGVMVDRQGNPAVGDAWHWDGSVRRSSVACSTSTPRRWRFTPASGATRRRTSSRTRSSPWPGKKSDPDRAVAWLYRVVRNGAIAAARQSRRRRRREQRAADREVVPGASWFAATDDQIDAEHAARLLAELDLETREVIVARLWGGLTFEEIARLQGCSLTTAHRRYQAGLARLHERLESRWTSITTNSTRPESAGASPGRLAAVRRRARPRPDALRCRPGRGQSEGRIRAWRLATAALVFLTVGLGAMLRAGAVAAIGVSRWTLAARACHRNHPGPPVDSRAAADRAPAPSSYFALTARLTANPGDASWPDAEIEREPHRPDSTPPEVPSATRATAAQGHCSGSWISDPPIAIPALLPDRTRHRVAVRRPSDS